MAETISVIMPNLNMGNFLGAALTSIARQSVPVHEIILIDSGSTDDSLEVAQQHRASGAPIHVLNENRLLPAAARNRGLAVATGSLMAFLDADDLWPEGKLARQTSRLNRLPRVDMVTGYIRHFETTTPDGLAPAPGSRTSTLFHVNVGACLYRREVFARLGGGFDETLVYSEDVDLLLRVREQGIPFTILRSVELEYRKHPGSMMSQDDPRKDHGFAIATQKSLLRRRAAGTLRQPLPDFASFLEPAP